MQARIQKWTNSLAVRIPRTIASEAGMEEQTHVFKPSHRNQSGSGERQGSVVAKNRYVPDRGDVVWISFDPHGHEQAGRRPAGVLSPRRHNEAAGRAIMCPITSKPKASPFEVVLQAPMAVQGAVLAEQSLERDIIRDDCHRGCNF